jgi:Tfp pilus assembly protein PilF
VFLSLVSTAVLTNHHYGQTKGIHQIRQGLTRGGLPSILLGMENSMKTLFAVLLALELGLVGCALPEQEKRPALSHQERARMFVEIANGALMEGDAVGALQQLAKAEAEDENLPELHHSRALAYIAKHDSTAAIMAAKKAVEIKPDYPEANNTLGKLLLDAGKYKEALLYLKIAAANHLYRDVYKASTNIGIIKYRLNELLQAESSFDRAIQGAPDRACVAYYYRGHIQLKRSHFKEAINDYEQATKKYCAKFGDGHLALGIAYEQSRQYLMARKTFVELQKLYPNTKLAEQAVERLKNLP